MRRHLVLTVALVGLALLALPASATHEPDQPPPDPVVIDAAACLLMEEGSHSFEDPNQSDRSADCRSDGDPTNGVEFYIGGESRTEHPYDDPAVPEEEKDDDTGDPCGAIVINGYVVAATRTDDPNTPDVDESLDWDFEHPHPDGTMHRHTCD